MSLCGSEETNVKDSRVVDDGKSIKRRRVCSVCGARFTTFERIEVKEIVVVKKSGETEFFDIKKITFSNKDVS